jgi:hypothetical protein
VGRRRFLGGKTQIGIGKPQTLGKVKKLHLFEAQNLLERNLPFTKLTLNGTTRRSATVGLTRAARLFRILRSWPHRT